MAMAVPQARAIRNPPVRPIPARPRLLSPFRDWENPRQKYGNGDEIRRLGERHREKGADRRAFSASGRSEQIAIGSTKLGGIKTKAKGSFKTTPLDPLEACSWHLWHKLVEIFQKIGLRATLGKVMGMPSHRKF